MLVYKVGFVLRRVVVGERYISLTARGAYDQWCHLGCDRLEVVVLVVPSLVDQVVGYCVVRP